MGVNESNIKNDKESGFRIYKIINGGPLDKAGLKILDDFLIPPEEINKKISFPNWIKENENKTIKLNYYSISKRKILPIEIQLNNSNDKNGILGGTINYENFSKAYKKVLHVIKVKENSFSKNELHLDELNDYLIALKPEDGDFQTLNGSNENPLKAFSQIIKNNIGKKCDFYIYNKKIGAKDICVNIPNDQMFEMGCDVAFGKLHEFPFISNEKNNEDEEKELKYDMDEK
jgi:hypothetical protein